MKTNAFLWRAVCLFMAALTTYVVCSCGDDDNPITPDPKPQENSEVSFTITNNGGTTGTPSAPVEVPKGDTLNMVISQKSSYKDVDGSVFSCEPKAKIELFAKLDTVYAKDVKTLTDVTSQPEVKSSQSGSKPVSHLTTQTFSVGGSQNIVFNLTHEVFNYVNKAEQTIEMPYVKPNQASFGNAVSEEKETRALEPVITLKALALTRASVTDTTQYMVSVKFNLELESVNAKTTTKQPVEFVVNYVGVVETTTELPDPVSELSYETSTTGGTSVSPFVVNPKEKFNLMYSQTSKYTDSFGNVFECSPKAQLSLHAVNDTVRAKSLDELISGTFTHTEKDDAAGENPITRNFSQTFIFGETQQIIFDTSTEIYQTNDGIEMPYMKFNPATFVSKENADTKTRGADVCVFATAVKLPQTRATETHNEYYEIQVKFKMDAETVNTAEKQTVPMEFSVSYVGVVTTVTELPDPVSEYSYTTSTNGGTSSSPFVVNPKEKFDLTYDGISRHTDSYGNVIEHNAKAQLSLHAVNDTVRAKSLDELISGTFTHTEKDDATGENPTVYTLSQTFNFGEGQEIVFDTKTEAYRMKNGDELPYMKFNPATFVSKENADTKTRGADVCVFATAVKIPQTPQTRVTETHNEYYEIHIKFKMDAETVNATKKQTVPMEFDISYVGVVEVTTELPDPKGEFSYTTSATGGTSVSPFVVNPKETFVLTFVGTCKYTDSYGNVVEREPKAQLSLRAANDTVRAKSLDELISGTFTHTEKENATGENPTTRTLSQTFNFGEGQEIVFDTKTEAYRMENGDELPYMKFNPATLVSKENAQTRNAKARVFATAVKLPQTRATETHNEYYEIQVKFKMDAETVNTTEKQTEPMEFSVSYVGVVETTTELPDPVSEITYKINTEGGSSSSPFVVNPKETFVLTLAGTSKYTDSYGNTVERKPKAQLSLYAASDTVWAKSLDEILSCPFTEKTSEDASGSNPKKLAMTQIFSLGTAQNIVFDTRTEVYETTDGIELPYMKFNPAVLIPGENGNSSTRSSGSRVVATAVKIPAPQTRATTTHNEYYEIQVKFKMDAESVNATEKQTEPMEFSVSYVGVVTTEVEAPELVNVTYRTDYEWQDDCVASHLGYYAIVWRDRHYSNGEVISDRFVDNGHPIAAQGSIKSAIGDISAVTPDLTGSLNSNWLGLIEYRSGGVSVTDSILTLKAIAVIDSLQNVNVTSQYGKRYAEPGDWSSYMLSKAYSADQSINGSTENGWYFYNFNFVHGYGVDIYTSDISIDQYDQYLLIDGQRIDFLKYFEEPVESTSETDLPATDTTGPGKRYTHILKMKRMGRNFITTSIIDIYQRK